MSDSPVMGGRNINCREVVIACSAERKDASDYWSVDDVWREGFPNRIDCGQALSGCWTLRMRESTASSKTYDLLHSLQKQEKVYSALNYGI